MTGGSAIDGILQPVRTAHNAGRLFENREATANPQETLTELINIVQKSPLFALIQLNPHAFNIS